MTKQLPDLNIAIAMVAPIRKLSKRFDYILIDTTPSKFESASLMGMGASDIVVVIDGVDELKEDIQSIRETVNIRLQSVELDPASEGKEMVRNSFERS